MRVKRKGETRRNDPTLTSKRPSTSNTLRTVLYYNSVPHDSHNLDWGADHWNDLSRGPSRSMGGFVVFGLSEALIIVKVAAEYGIRKVWQKTLFWDQLNPQWQDHNVVGTKTSFGDAQLGSSSIASISTES